MREKHPEGFKGGGKKSPKKVRGKNLVSVSAGKDEGSWWGFRLQS